MSAVAWAALSASCGPQDDTSFDWYKCINGDQLPLQQALPTDRGQQAYAKTSKLWGAFDPAYPGNARLAYPKKIHVCWRESAYAQPQYEKARATVRQAIEQTWQKALDIPGLPEDQKIRFYGWDECGNVSDGFEMYALRLDVKDVRPHASGLGTENASPTRGLTLNFDYSAWARECGKNETARTQCIHHIAMHEFGHALGLAHEQARPDTDRETCKDAPEGGPGDLMIGAWDKDSVMNYCNPKWNNDGKLSEGDVYGIQRAYYPEYFSGSCAVPATPTEQASVVEFNTGRYPAVSARRASKEFLADPVATPQAKGQAVKGAR